ncbi:IclR family transcriptional regulator [Brevibacillus marinus]|uniref:IclR family transcriptional regulator n=1 Tax=Brevibacillus marinus TaxID=2496837 RepID=UPI000F823C0E|nr:IclR family transcriptional regulator [Brevibacillus marinus]
MTLKTLDNSLELLKYFTKQTPAWGLRELAKEMNMNHTIVYRILSTFERHGFLVQNPETKKYELGIKFWEYGQIVQERLRPSDLIHPIMKRLSEETGESTFLTWLDGLEGIYVEIVESSQRIKYAVTVGSRVPLYAGASSKVIMAYLPREQQEAIIQQGLKPFTDKTIVDPEQLLANLQEIRQKGWCFSVGEYSDSVFGLSVPLFNHRQEIVASLTIAGPEYRMPQEKVADVLPLLLQSRDEIQACFDKFHIRY